MPYLTTTMPFCPSVFVNGSFALPTNNRYGNIDGHYALLLIVFFVGQFVTKNLCLICKDRGQETIKWLNSITRTWSPNVTNVGQLVPWTTGTKPFLT